MSGPYRTPQADIYTALLAIALVAIIVATVFAYLETADYGPNKYQGAPTVPPLVGAAQMDVAPGPICLAGAFADSRPAPADVG